MIYLVYGVQKKLVDKKVDELVKKHIEMVDDFNTIRYDGENVSLDNILDDAETLPFCCDKKVILVKNAYFFSTQELPKINFIQNNQRLLDYMLKENPSTILIFFVYSQKLDLKNELVKGVKKVTTPIEIENIEKKEMPHYIRKMLEERNISIQHSAIEIFINRVGNDLISIENEIIKLQMFSDLITDNVVEALIAAPLEDNVFMLSDAILERKTALALAIYRDLRIQNEEPTRLVTIMASQVRLMYQVVHLAYKGFNETQIAKELEIHPYRVTLALRRKNKVNKEKLLTFLDTLAGLDIGIKTGQISKDQAFELFLIK